ncbi:hypothetical protein GUJ93_ZPchr0003g17276 [Zizania palustris]|uniref:Uncharacterized protein n=1 Tax=Zizania palustris TaxID=103762 RepID=A0A8J5SUP5_ZIZPA|nr:hypothetical protein GUJ93_ZPchr0003g17276 [Zizania palustris]
MQGGVSGFQNVPVTRAVVLASGLLSVVFSAQRRVRTLGLSYQKHFMSIAKAAAKGFRCSSMAVDGHLLQLLLSLCNY